jgi:hypothetical protein
MIIQLTLAHPSKELTRGCEQFMNATCPLTESNIVGKRKLCYVPYKSSFQPILRLRSKFLLKITADHAFALLVSSSVAEPYHFYAAPAPDTNFDAALAAPAPALAPTLLYSKAKFLK